MPSYYMDLCLTGWAFPQRMAGWMITSVCISTSRWRMYASSYAAKWIRQWSCSQNWMKQKELAWLSASVRVKAAPQRSMWSDLLARVEFRLRQMPSQDFGKVEIKTSENQKSRLRKNRSQDFGKAEVKTSEKPKEIILKRMILISVKLIYQSIRRSRNRLM